MDNTISTNLCKGLRACGIPKELALNIVNEVSKWDNESGREWTVKRIKSYRAWYESCLAGNPDPPEWFKHSETGRPLGVWKKVFDLPTGKALGVLSLSTVFFEKTLTEAQLEKFQHGTSGNQQQDPERLETLMRDHYGRYGEKYSSSVRVKLPRQMPAMSPVSIESIDLNKSTPVKNATRSITPKTDAERLMCLKESWESIPQVTFNFLLKEDRFDILPPSVVGNDFTLELERPHSLNVGRIGVIQEPELKARIVANPNRITQHTLVPLQELLQSVEKQLPSCSIYDQDAGMQWAKAQLQAGYVMACSDLTSASDLLDLEQVFRLVDNCFALSKVDGYSEYRDYFLEVSRSNWYMPAIKDTIRWAQGDPLGTGPSINYLDLANQCAALVAYKEATYHGWNPGKNPDGTRVSAMQCFRTIGDDIIMRAEMRPYYEEVISALGGEINHSKTIESNKVAEFAGRVITEKAVYLKKVNYCEPSDNSFMSYVSQLGAQAKWFLRPRQRKVWEKFEPIPGVVVPGPYSQDSFGEPLSDRYQWYLEEVQPVFDREEPDPEPQTVGEQLLAADLAAQVRGIQIPEEAVMPFLEPEDYQSSVATKHRSHGDPRLVNDKTALEILEGKQDSVQDYHEWKSRELQRRIAQAVKFGVDSATSLANRIKGIKTQVDDQPNRVEQPIVEPDKPVSNTSGVGSVPKGSVPKRQYPRRPNSSGTPRELPVVDGTTYQQDGPDDLPG